MDVQLKSLAGKVSQETVAAGSKSERSAIVLNATNGRTYILRSQDGPGFVDMGLKPLVGRSIKADGVVSDRLFVMRNWEFIE